MHVNPTRSTICAFALIALAVPRASVAQEGETEYAVVDCMKSASPDYTNVETEIWQPMHQAMVNQGKKGSWTLYSVRFGDRSECDYYTSNHYVGEAQLNDDTSYEQVFAAVHPGKSWDEAMARTAASRVIVRSELWAFVDGVPPQPSEYITVNYMYTENGSDYTAMESEVYKPVHQALVDAGHRVGWSVWQLMAPGGTSIPYNYATVDASNMLGPVPWGEFIERVHAGRDLAAINQATMATRDLVHSATWVRLAGTQ
jgi:hypothetical protein